MTIRNKTFTGLTILALLFASIAALFAGSLLVGGIPLTTLQEIPEGLTQEQIPSATTAFYPPAVPMLLSALALIGGLFTRKLWLAWLGFAALTGLSILFLFSSGAALLPIDLILLILLIALTLMRRRDASV